MTAVIMDIAILQIRSITFMTRIATTIQTIAYHSSNDNASNDMIRNDDNNDYHSDRNHTPRSPK